MANQYSISVVFNVIDKALAPLSHMGAGFKNLGKTIGNASKPLNEFGAHAKEMGGKLSGFGSSMTMGVTAPIIALGTIALNTAGKFETLNTEFAVMLGSTDKASKFVAELRAMGAVTPFETLDLAQNAKTMMAFGIETEKILPTLSMLGDVAGNNTEKLRSLTLAFSKISSGGKMTGENLMMMIDAGFNPLKIISEKTGVSMTHLQDLMAKGAISTEAVTQAFTDATSKGGMFYQNMLKQSQTIPGLMSTLKDAITDAFGTLGDSLKVALELGDKIDEQGNIIQEGTITKLTKGVKEMAIAFGDWAKENPAIMKFIVTMLGILAVIGPVLLIVGKLITVFGVFMQVCGFLSGAIAILFPILSSLIGFIWSLGVAILTTPVGWFLLAIMAIAGAVYLIIKYWKPIKVFFKNLFSGIGDILKRVGKWFSDTFKEPLSALWEGLVGIWDGMWEKVQEIGAKVKAYFKTMFPDWFVKRMEGDNNQVPATISDKAISDANSKMGTLSDSMKNWSNTVVELKITTDSGTTATVEKVENKKGNAKVNVNTGNIIK